MLLIKTGNVHKERMLSQTIIHTFKKCKRRVWEVEALLKMMVMAKWWFFSQLQK